LRDRLRRVVRRRGAGSPGVRFAIIAVMPGTPTPPPIAYRDHQSRVWYVSEVARLKVVSPAIDGPNLCLVIRFEREGEERFSRWIGGDEWIERGALHRLFAEAEPGDPVEPPAPAVSEKAGDAGVGPAPPETVALWVQLVATMCPDELADFEDRTFRQWDRASLSVVRIAIDRRRRELGGKA
jgi:hypothetical protein